MKKIIIYMLDHLGLPKSVLDEHGRLLKYFSKNHSLILLSNISHGLIGLVLFPIKARMLGVENFGILTLLATTPTFISAFIFLGLNTSIAKYMAEPEKKRDRVEISRIVNTMIVYCLIAIVVSALISAPILFYLIGNSQLIKLYILLLAFTLIENVFAMFCRGLKRFKTIAIYPVLSHLISLVLIVSLCFFYRINLSLVIAADCLAIFLACVFLVIRNRDIISIKARPSFDLFRKMLLFSLPLVFCLMFSRILIISDKYFIAYFIDLNSVGLYSAASQIGNIARVLISPLSLVLLPILLSLFANKEMQKMNVLSTFIKKALMIYAGYIVVVLTLYSSTLLKVLTGFEFANSNILIAIIGLSIILFSMQYVYSLSIIINENTRFLGKLYFLATLVDVILNIILIKAIGMIGASIATLSSIAILFGLTYRYVRTHHPEFISAIGLREITMVILPCILTVCFSLGFMNNTALGLGTTFVGFIVSTVIYFSMTSLLLKAQSSTTPVRQWLYRFGA